MPTVVTLPKDCRTIIGTASSSDFAKAPLNDPSQTNVPESGVVAPTQPKAGASTEDVVAAAMELSCLWRHPEADATGLLLVAGHVNATLASSLLAELAGKGYKCTTPHGGKQCQSITRDSQYPIDDADTVFARDGIVIRVQQSNVVTHDLIGSVVATIWK